MANVTFHLVKCPPVLGLSIVTSVEASVGPLRARQSYRAEHGLGLASQQVGVVPAGSTLSGTSAESTSQSGRVLCQRSVTTPMAGDWFARGRIKHATYERRFCPSIRPKALRVSCPAP